MRCHAPRRAFATHGGAGAAGSAAAAAAAARRRARPSSASSFPAAAGSAARPTASLPSASPAISRQLPRRREASAGLPEPPPFIIIGSQTILNTLHSNPSSVEEIVIDQAKLKNPRIATIAHLARKEGILMKQATKERVNSLSKNSRQDQGIVAKVKPLNIIPLEDYLGDIKFGPSALVALDGVTNPQNIGIMLRSFAAGDYINGVIIPRFSCPPASHPLVIKASAGTVLHSKVKILDCLTVEEAIMKCNVMGFSVVGLDQRGANDIFTYVPPQRVVYVIGNETMGLNARTRTLLTKRIRIPMGEQVESLNVAVAASFIGYMKHFAAAKPTPSAMGFRRGKPVGASGGGGKRNS